MARLRPVYVCLLLSMAAIAWSGRRLSNAMEWRYPPPSELVVTEHYLTDLGALLMGARRLAADVAYIQFLQYYGVREHQEGESEEEHAHHSIEGGSYPRLGELSTRFLRLDPSFHGAVLESAGSLAFNLKRVDESLAILREAIERDPTYYRYHMYVSAILFKEKGNDQALIDLLLPAIKDPESPALFQLMLGNVLKKVGRVDDAADVFAHVARTAPQPSDRRDAEARLLALLMRYPHLRTMLDTEIDDPAEAR